MVASAARVLIGLVFLAAVAGKARDLPGFAASVRELPSLPRWLVRPAVPGVLGAEAAVVLLLADPTTSGWGFALALGMDAAFIAVIIRVLRSGTPAACACFGSKPREFGVRHVVRDALLGLVALIGLAAAAGTHDQAQISVPAWVLCAAAGSLGALVLVLFDEIADLYVS